LFPYREPDSKASSTNLDVKHRVLRIYFIAETQYEGKINGNKSWSGKSVWSGEITPHRESLLNDLNLPNTTGPAKWWLTLIEDKWPYEKAAGDVYFSPVAKQRSFNRNNSTQLYQMDVFVLIILAAFSCTLRMKKRS